jgi:hypothetical protein
LAEQSAETQRLWGSGAWLLVFVLAVTELAGHAVIRARVPDGDEWERAAAYVGPRLSSKDAVTVAPPWADPLVRRAIGERMSLGQAASGDLASYERLWAFTLRGHRPKGAPDRPPDVLHRFGRVHVLRWDLGPSPVVFDFVEQVYGAKVSLGEGARACPLRTGAPRGGGLGAGPAVPAARFECDARRPWLWVGSTVLEDLDLEPRRCVWQHPQGPEPVRVTYEDVPLGDRLVLHAGLYYEHERKRTGGPVHLQVRVDGEPVGEMVHRDGDGWKPMEMRLQRRADRGRVEIEVTARRPHLRSLCWAATMQKGQRP